MWPKDLLAKDIETARIVTFGYDADIVNALDTASSNTLRDHGSSLALTLARWRVRTKSVGIVRPWLKVESLTAVDYSSTYIRCP